jgi:TRAP-type C4-dicarboxylate transport system permease small subunit
LDARADIPRFANRAIDVISNLYIKLGGWAVTAMMMVVAVDVIGRNTISFSILGTSDLVICLMPIVSSSSLAYLAMRKEHINADVVLSRLPTKPRAAANLLNTVCGLVFCALVAWQTIASLGHVRDMRVVSGALPIPVYPFVGFVGVAFLILALVLFKDLIEYILRGFKS